MLNTSIMRLASSTYRLDLTTSASATLKINSTTNDQTNLISLLNTGNGVAAVEFANASGAVVSPSIGSTGSNGSFILPANMNFPLIVVGPPAPFYIKAKSSSTNSLFITAVENG